MRKAAHLLSDLEPAENWPASGVDAVAADFLARKFFPLENRRSQTGGRAKSTAARTGRPGADDSDIEHSAVSASAGFFAGAF